MAGADVGEPAEAAGPGRTGEGREPTGMRGTTRHTPLRSCVICSKKTGKSDLLRIVATPEGAVKVDLRGKLPGRGAYICADGRCSDESHNKSHLDHALRRRSKQEDWTRIDASLEALRSSSNPAPLIP